ncbi:MAG: fibronectin type III domain-containing protein [Acidobacteriota bacterium]
MCSDANPTPRRRHGQTLLAIGLLLLPLVAACGKKGPPLPPLRNVPKAVTDLSIQQQGSIILLDLAYPSTTQSGAALGGIDAVELLTFDREIDPEQLEPPPAEEGEAPQQPAPIAVDAGQFDAGSEVLLVLRGAELGAAIVGDRIQIRLPLADPLPEPQLAQAFAVRTTKGPETSQRSNIVTIVPLEPPRPPRLTELEASAEGVVVKWDVQGEDPEAFDIFRRQAQVSGYDEPLRRVDGSERSFVDRRARFDQRYIYTVRAAASTRPVIYSDAAGEREIEYIDRFAPPLPQNFVALPDQEQVRLRWDASRADDVAGYRIYRREPGRDFTALTTDLVTATEYVDSGLSSGFRFEYRIQVVDQNGNESAMSAPVAATVR